MNAKDMSLLIYWALKFAEINGMYDIRYNRNVIKNFCVAIIDLGISPGQIESVTFDKVCCVNGDEYKI